MALMHFDEAAIKSMMEEAFNQQARAYYEKLPAPDQQFTCDEVAEFLRVDVDTVRSYLKLPAAHPRHLPHVRCTDAARGNRIRLSAVQAWQERNTGSLLEEQAKEPESMLRISHRRAAKRDKRKAA